MYYQLYSVIFLSLSLAQTQNVNWAFISAGIVPDILDEAPNKLAFVEYPSNTLVRLGNQIPAELVQAQPEITWEADPRSYYTIFLTSRLQSESSSRQFHHWLVINARDEAGEVVYSYLGPNPPKGGGIRKYVFLVYRQPSKLIFDHKRYDRTVRGRTLFSVVDFARKYHLGTPVAGNYFTSQYDYYKSRSQHLRLIKK